MARKVNGRQRSRRAEIEELLRGAEALGCVVSGGGHTHYKIKVPGRGMVVVSGSPSDRRTVANTMSRLRQLGIELRRAA